MNYLLDTSVFLWITCWPKVAKKKIHDLFEDPSHKFYLSSVSSWEVSQKYHLNKLSLPEQPSTFIPSARMYHNIYSLSLEEPATVLLESLPLLHKDPADRLLICQSIHHNMPIITNDKKIQQYEVETVW